MKRATVIDLCDGESSWYMYVDANQNEQNLTKREYPIGKTSKGISLESGIKIP